MSSSSSTRKFGLIVVAAPSGAGKSTLCTEFLRRHSARVALSISSTSRAPRGKEVHGTEYFFHTNEEFRTKIESGIFAEWALVHDRYYGTSKETLENFWSQGKHVLLDIDVQGAESLRNAYPDRCFSVFISPPSLEVLEQRLRGRGTETEEAILKRMTNARTEMAEAEKFDLILVNDDLNETYRALENEALRFMDQLEEGLWQKRP